MQRGSDIGTLNGIYKNQKELILKYLHVAFKVPSVQMYTRYLLCHRLFIYIYQQ